MRTILLTLALVAMVATPVAAASDAERCDMAQLQIDRAYGKRFDKQAAQVRTQQVQAQRLHKQGKHSDALKVYEAAAKTGGVTLTYPK